MSQYPSRPIAAKTGKASRTHTKDEDEHLTKVAALGCILCHRLGNPGTPAEVHHIRTGIGAGRRASHFQTIGLCPLHHRTGQDAIHVLGRKAFESKFGVTELELLELTNQVIGEVKC